MRRILVWCIIFFVVTDCCGMGPIKKVSPSASDTLQTIVNRTAQVFDEVTATPVFDSDHVGPSIYLWRAGNYQLAQDLMHSVVITASGVSLDLRQHKITPYPLAQTAITIASATPLQQIYIKNGIIEDASTAAVSGVYIPANATKIFLKNLTISGFDKGVWCAGTGTSNKVTQCSFSELSLLSNRIGILFDWADANIIKQCTAVASSQSGFELNNCQTNCFFDCQALQTTGTATVAGFKSTGGTNNLFQRCVAQQTKTSSTIFGDTANGFLLTGTELKTRVVDCTVGETDVLASSTSAVTYGISLRPVLLSSPDLFSVAKLLTNQGNQAWGAAWSPDGKYVAVPFSGGTTCSIYAFDATTNGLVVVTTVSAIGSGFSSVDWSPDGKYIAMGLTSPSDGFGRLRVYRFDGQVLTLVGYSTVPVGQVFCVGWSPNGKYLVSMELNSPPPGYVRLFSFDGTNLVNISTTSIANQTSFVNDAVSWSPDGSWLAVASTSLNIIPVSSSGIMGTVVTGATSFNIACLKWSPCGKYIVLGDTSSYNIRIYTWNGTGVVAGPSVLGNSAAVSLKWSPDGNYIIAGDQGSRISFYQFTGTAVTSIVYYQAIGFFYGLSWSADGQYIVGSSGAGAAQVVILRAMYGPQSCCIENCVVNDTLAASQNMGRGCAGGGNNVFLNNVASNNVINYSYGIPNVYDGRFEISRSAIQPYDNISEPTTL